MKTAFLVLSCFALSVDAQDDQQSVVVVVGAPGTPEYGGVFEKAASRWGEAAEQSGTPFTKLGIGGETAVTDRDVLRQTIEDEGKALLSPLWLVLIGHGTFDGRQAKFNLRGPDVTATELSEWLANINRPVAVICCFSSSGPFINKISGDQRIVVTATKSGYEINYSRFADHLSRAVVQPSADLDKDQQVSLLEAFLYASAKTQEFYKEEGRLATEHALIDDNGDGLGTPADWFRGVRATRSAKDGAAIDGLKSNQLHLVKSAAEQRLTPRQREKRDQLEQKIDQLRARKNELSEDDYYDRLESILLELAVMYRDAEPAPTQQPDESSTEEDPENVAGNDVES